MKYSTKAIFGKRALEWISADDYIHWAEEMLMEDYDSPSLRILAGLDRHNRFWEVESYFLRSIEELNIEEPDAKTAIRTYACEFAQPIIVDDGHFCSSKLALQVLYEIYFGVYRLRNDENYNYSDYAIWFKLNCTLNDLIEGDFPYLYPSATLENFDSILKQEAEIFLAKMASYN